MGRKPWFPFYVDDFWQDEAVQAMSYEEVGLYLRLLSLQWREGSIPSDLEKIGRICALDAQAMAKLWPSISPCFTNPENDPSRLVNRRLAQIEKEQTDVRRKLSERGKAGAHKRWGGHSSSNARALPNDSKSESKAKTTKDPPIDPPKGGPENDSGQSRKSKRKKPTTPPPDTFEPSQADMEWFRAKFGEVPRLEIRNETEMFLNHHRARGNQFAEWSAAWKNWITRWRTDFGRSTQVNQEARSPPRPNPNLVQGDD